MPSAGNFASFEILREKIGSIYLTKKVGFFYFFCKKYWEIRKTVQIKYYRSENPHLSMNDMEKSEHFDKELFRKKKKTHVHLSSSNSLFASSSPWGVREIQPHTSVSRFKINDIDSINIWPREFHNLFVTDGKKQCLPYKNNIPIILYILTKHKKK